MPWHTWHVCESDLRTFGTFMPQKLFTHFWRFFVAKTIYALRPESFCAWNSADRKVLTFCVSEKRILDDLRRSIYIWEQPLCPILRDWCVPSRIFVEEAHILKNAAKLANIPVHIVQVNNFPIKWEMLRNFWCKLADNEIWQMFKCSPFTSLGRGGQKFA